MGANSREFLRFEMEKNDYESLSNQVRSKMNLLYIDIKDYEYPPDEMLEDLQKKSIKAFKDLNKRKYELRHKKQ